MAKPCSRLRPRHVDSLEVFKQRLARRTTASAPSGSPRCRRRGRRSGSARSTGSRARGRPARELVGDPLPGRLREADQVHLVDREHRVTDAERATMKACRRSAAARRLRASIRMMARSAVEAPVAMLRVYCSWPGVSAMMKLRRVGREIAVGDVDGDALLALGRQARRAAARNPGFRPACPSGGILGRARRAGRPGPRANRTAAGRAGWTCRHRPSRR